MADLTQAPIEQVRTVIRQGRIEANPWQVLQINNTDDAAPLASPTLPNAPVLTPLALWLAQRAQWQERARAGSLGVWLSPTDDPAALAKDITQLQLIAIDFPTLVDGRGFSIAALLRNRYGYKNELRAMGAVKRDRLFYMQRVGFDAFALAADENAPAALAALTTFSESYQSAYTQPLPLFRRAPAHLLANPQRQHSTP